MISQQLQNGDAEFFYQEQLHKKVGYFFEVVLSFDENNMVTTNMDLSFFPFRTKTKMSDLSSDQRMEAKKLNRQPEKEPSKLASYLQRNHTVCEYCENLLWMMWVHSAVIVEIKTIVSFKVSLSALCLIQIQKDHICDILFHLLTRPMTISIIGLQFYKLRRTKQVHPYLVDWSKTWETGKLKQ